VAIHLWRADQRFEAVAASFEPLLLSVLGDLQQPVPIDLVIGYESADHMLWFSEAGEQSRSGFRVSGEGASMTADDVVELAYLLQEHVFHESQAAWGEPRPLCPRHGHPMAPSEVGGVAWWKCPLDDHAVVPIGDFRGSHNR
jgi:hypothetical protein